MYSSPGISNKKIFAVWTVFFTCLIVLTYRLTMPPLGMDTRGLPIWLDIFSLLILYGYVLLTAYGCGHFLLRRFGLGLTRAELHTVALLIGLGVISLGIMSIGLLGWLSLAGILVWLIVTGVSGFREIVIAMAGPEDTTEKSNSGEPRSRFEIVLQILILALIPLLLVSVVTPVWDYDALLYHMEIPRQFFREGRIFFDPETWRSAYPFLGEMTFLVGIAFDLNSLGKLINLTYAVLFFASAYVFSLRFVGRPVALTATAILIGAPAFLLWATWAAVDYAWATYEFWSLYAVFLWLSNGKPAQSRWLLLAGMMSGAAASIKYLSLPTMIIVGAIVVWKSFENTEQPTRNAVRNLLTFGLPAVAIMGAWYLKNWLWTGNPVYPLLFGGPGWEPIENQVLNDYVQTFGVGKTWLDYILLPYHVYAYQAHFATIPIESIHPALWLSVFVPLAARSNKILKTCAIYVGIYFVIWATTSQVIRFLLPVSGFAAILAAAVIERLPPLLRNLLKFGLVAGFVVLSLLHQIGTIHRIGAWEYFTGRQSAADLLQKANTNIGAIQYIQTSIDAEDRVQFLWDGRGYYCDQRCIPDDEQSTAIRLSIGSPAARALAHHLRKVGITHLLLSPADARWFIDYHDPRGWHQDALTYFTDVFLPACGKSLFQSGGTELFEIICP